MWHGVVGCTVPDVDKDQSAFIFKVKDPNKQSMEAAQLGLLNPEEGGTMTLRTTRNHMPDNTHSHPGRTESSIVVYFSCFSTLLVTQLLSGLSYHSWVFKHIVDTYFYIQQRSPCVLFYSSSQHPTLPKRTAHNTPPTNRITKLLCIKIGGKVPYWSNLIWQSVISHAKILNVHRNFPSTVDTPNSVMMSTNKTISHWNFKWL
jgi:hypothetical protein